MRSPRSPLLLAVLASALVSPIASRVAAAAEVVVFTEADAGRTVHVTRGDAFRVRLTPDPGARWGQPQVSGEDIGVLLAGLQLDGTVTDGFFQARSASTNTITLASDLPCAHSNPQCLSPTASFEMTVVVDDGPRPEQYPAPPELPDAAVPDAIDVDRSNADGVFTLEEGQRLSVRLDYAHQVVAPGMYFVEKSYLDRTTTHVVLRAMQTSGLLDVDAYGVPDCIHDEPMCVASVLRLPWHVAVGTPGSTPRGVAVTLDHSTVTAGNSPVVTARLTTDDGSPAYGGVDLYEKTYGESSYRRIGMAATEADGTIANVVRPTVQTAYVAVVHTTRGRTASAASVVRVHSRITVRSPAPGASVAQRTTFVGSTYPVLPGVEIGLAVVRGGSYTFLGKSVTSSTGEWTLPATMPTGTATYVVYTSAHSGTAYGSKSLTLSVR